MLARDREPRKAVHLRLDVRETAPREQSEDSANDESPAVWPGSQRACVIRVVPGGEPLRGLCRVRPLVRVAAEPEDRREDEAEEGKADTEPGAPAEDLREVE
jgi:hypothetical protein